MATQADLGIIMISPSSVKVTLRKTLSFAESYFNSSPQARTGHAHIPPEVPPNPVDHEVVHMVVAPAGGEGDDGKAFL